MDTFSTLETIDEAPENPEVLFKSWMAAAEKSEPSDPNAMALATIDANGRPSVRIVLLKQIDERGFTFFTNRNSRKGKALSSNPFAALNFHWKTLSRAIRIEGTIDEISDAESDDYYNSRPYGSRIGAWASNQSQPLESRTALADRITTLKAFYPEGDPMPRPPHWGGYRVIPDRIEFWCDGESRLHTRLQYTRTGKKWTRQMLYP